MNRRVFLAAAAALAARPIVAQAQTTSVRLRGTIKSLNGHTLDLTTRDGDAAQITLADNYTVGAIVPATMDAIKPGVMIGIVGFGPPEHQRAAVISLFPPGATVNAAQFPWDSQKDSVMTNAPVTSEVRGTEGRTLTVTIDGKKIDVTVPPNAIIQTSEPGTPAMLVPGAAVLVIAQKAANGALTAARVNVGKNGYVPAN